MATFCPNDHQNNHLIYWCRPPPFIGGPPAAIIRVLGDAGGRVPRDGGRGHRPRYQLGPRPAPPPLARLGRQGDQISRETVTPLLVAMGRERSPLS